MRKEKEGIKGERIKRVKGDEENRKGECRTIVKSNKKLLIKLTKESVKHTHTHTHTKRERE